MIAVSKLSEEVLVMMKVYWKNTNAVTHGVTPAAPDQAWRVASKNKMLLGILLAVVSTNLFAEEQRCTELGAACYCSEPLNTDTLVPNGTHTYNPADSTTKECDAYGGAGGNAMDIKDISMVTTGNSAGVLNELPPGHSVKHYVRGIEGQTNTWFLGAGNVPASVPMKQISMRWYVYHSNTLYGDPNDHEWKNQGGCTNSKFTQNQWNPSGMIIGARATKLHIFNIGGWTHNNGGNPFNCEVNLDPNKCVVDCCTHGPPTYDGASWSDDGRLRKWFRYELVFDNRAGGASPDGLVVRLYEKNITDNLAEKTIIDTSIKDSNVGPYNRWLGATDLTPNSPIDYFYVNSYRQDSCKGYRAISHYMVAAWNTTGQRIGSAAEVEGVSGAINPNSGGSVPQTPATPTVQKQ